MREIETGTAEVNGITIRYYLVEEPLSDTVFHYGLRVRGDNGEEATVLGVTIFPERAVEAAELLCRHAVTPVAVKDVISDWILSED